MSDPADLDPVTLRAIADSLSADADAEAEAADRRRAGEPGPDGRGREYAEGYAAGALVSYLADKAGELRSLALRIELGRQGEDRPG
jgi:hypothetical protein